MGEQDVAYNSSVEGRLTSLEIRMAVNENDVKAVRDEIKGIKDDTKWLRRTITGALITSIIIGIIGVVFALIKFVIIPN
jgi:hypothetical protein